MPYERLIKTNMIKAYQADDKEISQLLQVAERDYLAGEQNLENAPDWAYSMAYNAILQAGRAFMFKKGYRPRGANQHGTVVEFLKEGLGSQYSQQVHLLDQMRRKRHRVIYEVAGLVSAHEAEQAVSFARQFVNDLIEIIHSSP